MCKLLYNLAIFLCENTNIAYTDSITFLDGLKFLRIFRLDSRISGAHNMWQDNINFGESFGLRGRNRTVAGEVGGTPGPTLSTHYTDTNGES